MNMQQLSLFAPERTALTPRPAAFVVQLRTWCASCRRSGRPACGKCKNTAQQFAALRECAAFLSQENGADEALVSHGAEWIVGDYIDAVRKWATVTLGEEAE